MQAQWIIKLVGTIKFKQLLLKKWRVFSKKECFSAKIGWDKSLPPGQDIKIQRHVNPIAI